MAKLRIKHGAAEFEAEGEPDEIKAQYDAFLALLKTVPPADTDTLLIPPIPIPPPADELLVERIFARAKDGSISLKVLPPPGARRNADGLLLLIYGAQKLGGMENVFGAHLSKVARMSGIHVERIDRALAPHTGLLVRGGRKRGATYSLNNPGMATAEEIMRSIFG